MKSKRTTEPGQKGLYFRESSISKVEGLDKVLSSFTKRISISYSSSSTVNTYRRAEREPCSRINIKAQKSFPGRRPGIAMPIPY